MVKWKHSETGSIHFMQFPATLVQLVEPPPPPPAPKQGKILRLDLSISCNFRQLWFSWQKSSLPQHPNKEKFWLDLSISCNFQQLWFSWQKSPSPSTQTGENSETGSIHFMHFPSTWFSWQKSPSPSTQTGENSETGSMHFMQFPATLVQLAEKPPPQHPSRENLLRLDLSISVVDSGFPVGGCQPHRGGTNSWGSYVSKNLYVKMKESGPVGGHALAAPPGSATAFHAISINFASAGRKVPPLLPFHGRPSLCCTCAVPMVPILQIHTQIPPIQISSLCYQLCQLFIILTYTKGHDTRSWCRWKAYKQPYHNTH